ncbi:MAG: MmcQ/YjbR family DNA-binding protein [Ruminococcaceae bacterium]|nr:MmcQ/YjbR family DNA-binding protein [Oscillospiraceae bacterium]
MYKDEISKYITETYGAAAEHPFSDDNETTVFRHTDNKKWFAIMMKIPKNKLGIYSDEKIHVMNLKCEFVLASSLFSEEGIFPAYHMNKKHWISVCLDGSVDIERIKWLIAVSFDLTKTKKKAKRTP